MKVNFVKPKLSSTSSKEDILFAINQIVEIEKEIDILKKININNYTEFIQEHSSKLKLNFQEIILTFCNRNSFPKHFEIFLCSLVRKKKQSWV